MLATAALTHARVAETGDILSLKPSPNNCLSNP
jgi:hypothetical protein